MRACVFFFLRLAAAFRVHRLRSIVLFRASRRSPPLTTLEEGRGRSAESEADSGWPTTVAPPRGRRRDGDRREQSRRSAKPNSSPDAVANHKYLLSKGSAKKAAVPSARLVRRSGSSKVRRFAPVSNGGVEVSFDS